MPIVASPDEAVAVTAVAGAGAAAVINRSSDPWTRKAAEAAAGAAVGVFVGPAVADLIGAREPHANAAVLFGVAAVGVGILTLWIDWAKGQGFREWVARFIGPTLPPGPR